MFSLPVGALRGLQLSKAVEAEASHPPWGLPSIAIQRTLTRHPDELSYYVFGALKRGIDLVGAEIVPAPKPRGLRPLAVLSVEERIAYRALVDPLKTSLELRERSFATFSEFNLGPVDHEGVEYVVRADVASYYQFVDHDFLREEIVDQTGNAAIAESISALLHGIQQRRIGLPQLYDPSDWLSEIAIDVVERRMLRSGYATFRFNDDFRIAATSWAQANEAIEALDRQLRNLGLALNDAKTFIQTVDHYRTWVELPEKTWAGITARLGLDIRQPEWEAFGDYQATIAPLVEDELEKEEFEVEEDVDEAVRDLWIDAAERALDLWLEGMGTERDRLHESIDRRLLRQALGILTTAQSPSALDYCKTVVTAEPHYTYLVGRYLRAIAHHQPDIVSSLVSGWVEAEIHLNSWQALWMLEPLLVLPTLDVSLASWVRRLVGDATSPDVLRARAVATLVAKNQMLPGEAAEIYDEITPAARPDIVAAVGAICDAGDPIRRALEKDSALNRLIVSAATAW